MEQLDRNKKRSMMLFALVVVSASAILSAILLGSTIHKVISGL